MIRHQFGQVEYLSEQWFRLAAATLAAETRAAGIATPAKARAARVRRADLVAAGDRLASLVLVLADGPVRQLLVPLDEPLTQDQLDEAARRLNEGCAGRTAEAIERRHGDLPLANATDRLVARAAGRMARALREFDAMAVEDVFSDGLLNVMEAPEFSQSEKLSRVFRALQDRAYLGSLVDDVARGGDVRLYIGHENLPVEMHDVTLVVAPYGRPGRATGLVGVLGPTRMAYPHAISTVRYVSGLMNELVDHLYA
jgi:heat-inducible transcriptional repressor